MRDLRPQEIYAYQAQLSHTITHLRMFLFDAFLRSRAHLREDVSLFRLVIAVFDAQVVKQCPYSPEGPAALTMKRFEETPKNQRPKSNSGRKGQGKPPANKIQHIGSLYRLLVIKAKSGSYTLPVKLGCY